MSWSTHVFGEAAEVRSTALADLANYNCESPEHSVKLAVEQAIDVALAACPAEALVEVDASGTQESRGEQGQKICTVTLVIRPIAEVNGPDDPKASDIEGPHRPSKAAPPKRHK